MRWEVGLEEENGWMLKMNWGLPRGGTYECNRLIFANSLALFMSPCEHPPNNAVGSMGESFFLIKARNGLLFGGLSDKRSRMVRHYTLFESHSCPLSQLVNHQDMSVLKILCSLRSMLWLTSMAAFNVQ